MILTKNDQFVKLFIYELYSGKFHFIFLTSLRREILAAIPMTSNYVNDCYIHDVKLCKR